MKDEGEHVETVNKLKRLQLLLMTVSGWGLDWCEVTGRRRRVTSRSGEEMVSLHKTFQWHLRMSMVGECVMPSCLQCWGREWSQGCLACGCV